MSKAKCIAPARNGAICRNHKANAHPTDAEDAALEGLEYLWRGVRVPLEKGWSTFGRIPWEGLEPWKGFVEMGLEYLGRGVRVLWDWGLEYLGMGDLSTLEWEVRVPWKRG